ncbi:hypothetical protein [Rhodoferax antarcticus]|uniref:Uncharacterized protein n=1 Tax=Rhodoferax antarcticus ANT.BR TaxID=1111071 RepID=A0A1Q8Y957_9BURK|nr:hypothetical protein [Rhodoferax antarcticus]OLP04467.1 hypothetical protein BLL52_4259 [Rhodoferax antarcticus ANT.BR]
MITELQPHGIARDEWVRRFKAAIITKAALETTQDSDEIACAELDIWPENDVPPVAGFDADWMLYLPEDAAVENLNNWSD